jgi:hypothetical protein
MSTTQSGTGWSVAHVDEVPPVKPDWPDTWKSIRHHFGVSAFGINAVTKDEGKVLIPEHHEQESRQQEVYFVHRGSALATLNGGRGRAGHHAQVRGGVLADHVAGDRWHTGQGLRDRRLGEVAGTVREWWMIGRSGRLARDSHQPSRIRFR